MLKPKIKKISWSKIRDKVIQVNPEFVSSVDQISPGENFHLYQVSLPYGVEILKNGELYLPTQDGKLERSTSSNISKQLQTDFAYSGRGMPVGVVLNRSVELSISAGERFVPWGMFLPGHIFGLWLNLGPLPSFHPSKIFTITSGARSIFMAPNIGDAAHHKNLRRDYNIRLMPPKRLIDQWAVFKAICEHPAVNSEWQTELLLFPNKWIEHIKNDSAWSNLLLYFLKSTWHSSDYRRNQIYYDFALSSAQANRNLRPNPYLVDTLKHLLAMSLGAAPGFSPAQSEQLAPIKTIQKAYLESYVLKNYAPLVFCPATFNFNHPEHPIYYSLQLPTTLEFSPKPRKLSSTLGDLSELKHITDTFLDELQRGKNGAKRNIRRLPCMRHRQLLITMSTNP